MGSPRNSQLAYPSTYVPAITGVSRPHLVVPTLDKYDGILGILVLLYKLNIINNQEVLFAPSYREGHTYYHRGPRPNCYYDLIRLLARLGVTIR
jgi:hypothetical protein